MSLVNSPPHRPRFCKVTDNPIPAAAKPRRLLFILKNGPIYSIGDHIAHQLSVLSQEFDCELWSRGDIEVDEWLYPGVHVRVLKSEYRPPLRIAARYAFDRIRRIKALARERDGDIAVLAHDPLRSGVMGLLLAWAARAPLIVEINGVYGNPDNYGAGGVHWKKRLRITLFRWVAQFVLSRASGVRLLFAGQLQGFAKVGRRAAVRTFFDITSIGRFRNAGEEKVILFVGFPFHTKGVDILIKAFDRLSGEFPDWRLELLGYEIGWEVARCSNNPRISVLKPVSNEDLAPIVNRAGIFVLPSRSEAMGRVLLEAAAAAKPRVASRVGGIPTVITHDEDGLLFEKEDVATLTAHLKTLMSSPELRNKLGAAARRRVETEFSDQAYLRHVKDLVDAAFRAQSGGAAHASVNAQADLQQSKEG